MSDNDNEEAKAMTEENTSGLAGKDDPKTGAEQHEFGEAESMEPIEELQKQLMEEQNKYLRLYAEFENFRKRNIKERVELIGSATSELMKELLPVLDDFERAVESNKSANDLEVVKQGFELLYQKLSKTLQAKGLKAINPMGETFDAEHHEAIAQIEAEDKKNKGKIIDVVERGYTLNDKVIRHPKVVVGT